MDSPQKDPQYPPPKRGLPLSQDDLHLLGWLMLLLSSFASLLVMGLHILWTPSHEITAPPDALPWCLLLMFLGLLLVNHTQPR